MSELRLFEVHRVGGDAHADLVEAEEVSYVAGGGVAFSRRREDEFAKDRLVMLYAPGTWWKVNSIEWKP